VAGSACFNDKWHLASERAGCIQNKVAAVKSVGILKEAGKLVNQRLVKHVRMLALASALVSSVSSGTPATHCRTRTCLCHGSWHVPVILRTLAAFRHEGEARAWKW